MAEGIALSELISRTADEIRKARDASPAGDGVLKLDSCELSLAVTLSAEGSAGLKVWLFEFGGSASAEQVSTITLKFSATGVQVFEAGLNLADPPVAPKRRAAKGKS